jgi:hypothetical protein
MGEARRRGKPAQYAPQVPKIRMFDAVAVDKLAFETEYAAFCARVSKVSQVEYLEMLIASALELARLTREAAQPAAPLEVRLPEGIQEAAARLQAMKDSA